MSVCQRKKIGSSQSLGCGYNLPGKTNYVFNIEKILFILTPRFLAEKKFPVAYTL